MQHQKYRYLPTPNESTKKLVWQELLKYGTNESMEEDFMLYWPKCLEFRFQGIFGMGGKIWWNAERIYATYYKEHHNSDLNLKLIDLNIALHAINEKRIPVEESTLH